MNLDPGTRANTTGPDGATVDYAVFVSATDAVDGPVPVSCSPASGTVFPIGVTTVTGSARDCSGNSASGSFDVRVLGATEQVDNLIALVDGYGLGTLGSSLTDKLTAVHQFLAAGKPRQAEENLETFLAQVDAQRGKGLTQKQADARGRTAHTGRDRDVGRRMRQHVRRGADGR